jgi:cytochrome b
MSLPSNKIKVWDPLIRLFHWSLVGTFITAYLTREEDYELHLLVGYCILGLICFRVLWGFVGSRYARFQDFLYPPIEVYRYLKILLRDSNTRYVGHNPAGGAMTILLLFTLLLITLSGIALDAAENRAGPLAGYRLFLFADVISTTHLWSTHVATVLVPLHLIGVILSGWRHGENLIHAMIHGCKEKRT